MPLPFEVPDARFAKVAQLLAGDEGVTRSDAAGLAELKPATPGGTVTFAGQTHPADANAAMLVTGKPLIVSGMFTTPPEPVYPVMVIVPLLAV